MQTFWNDLRYGLRGLIQQPGFALIAILTLGLGSGATTAIFSLVNAVLLRPLPFAQPEQLMALGQTWPKSRNELSSLSYRNFEDMRAQSHTFEQMSAYYPNTFILTGEGQPQRWNGSVVTHDFFSLLRVQPVLGRVFNAADDTAGGPEGLPVILSQRVWRKDFGADPQVLGRKLKLNSNEYTVVGVMPAGFSWPLAAEQMDVWVSLALDARQTDAGSILQSRGYRTWEAMGRLKPEATLAQARAELEVIANGLTQQAPRQNKDAGLGAKPMVSYLAGNLSYLLWMLFGAVFCVLLIACTNVANLLAVKASARRREIAIRAALGASQMRIVRQLLTESLLLAVAGGFLGILLAYWGIDGLRLLAPANIPRLDETGIDWRVLGFALSLSLLTGTSFGLLPAWQVAKPNLNAAFKEGGLTATEGRKGQRLRSALVMAELALSLVLLTGAGLLLQSFVRLQRVDPGFDPRNLLTFNLDLTGDRFEKAEPSIAFFRDLQERLKTLPGVTAVSMASFLPLGGSDPSTGFEIQGRPTASGEQFMSGVRIITPDYFHTMGIALKQGREFTDRDTLTSTPVAMINQAFAKQFFPNENPLGKLIKPSFATYGLEARAYEIVGIASDVHHESLRNEAPAEFYFPNAQLPFSSMTVLVRSDVPPRTLVPLATNIVLELDKNTPLYGVKTLNEYIARSLANPRMYLTLLLIFAVLAVVLAAVGLYGVMSSAVAQRTHEIGIRMALGASQREIMRLIVGQGMTMILLGIGLGVVASFAATRILQSMLFGVTATDGVTFAAVALVLGGVALLACYVPVRRATKVDPLIALRCE